MAKEKIESKSSNLELDDCIKDKINIEVEKAVRREEKKLIRNKNSKIIKRDIIIVILIFFYLLLGYNLYNTNYFDKFLNKYFNRNNETLIDNSVQSSEESINETKKEEDLKKYDELVNNYKLYQNSDNFNDYFSEKMSDDVKMELVFNYLSKEEFEKKDSILTIDKDKIDSTGEQLFSSFNSKPFTYFGSKVYLIQEDNLFLLSESKLDDVVPIKTEVIDSKVENSNLEIEAIIYYVKDNKVYNALTNKEVTIYNDTMDIKKYEKDLAKVEFNFEKNDQNEFVLKEIEKELD